MRPVTDFKIQHNQQLFLLLAGAHNLSKDYLLSTYCCFYVTTYILNYITLSIPVSAKKLKITGVQNSDTLLIDEI